MVLGMIPGDEFSTGGIDGVEMRAVLEDGEDALRYVTGLHLVVQNGLAVSGGEVEHGVFRLKLDLGRADNRTGKKKQQ
jgi:hypothetical protein